MHTLVGLGPRAAEQLDLDEVDRVHIRVADVDRAAQDRIRRERFVVPGILGDRR